jgi:hypothetical protein
MMRMKVKTDHLMPVPVVSAEESAALARAHQLRKAPERIAPDDVVVVSAVKARLKPGRKPRSPREK